MLGAGQLPQNNGDIMELALSNIGFVSHCDGDLDGARAAFSRAVVIRERLADRRGVAFMRTAIAWTLCRGSQLRRGPRHSRRNR
jgi:hypothetical protein